MSHNAYKGQKYHELFSTNNQLLLSKWKLHPNVKKVYDDHSKTYVYCLNGRSPLPLMHWPKDKINEIGAGGQNQTTVMRVWIAGDKERPTDGMKGSCQVAPPNEKTVNLPYPVIVFQMYFAVGANVLIHIGVTSYNNQRKRITLSSNQKSDHITSLSVMLPLTLKKAEMWSHLIVDVEDVVSTTWKKENLRNIDSLCVGGVLKVKRIFTLRKDAIFNQEGTWLVKYDELPKHMSLPKHISHLYLFIASTNSITTDKKDTSSDSVSSKSCYSGSSFSSFNSLHSESSYSRRRETSSRHTFIKSTSTRKACQTSSSNKSYNSNTGSDPFHEDVTNPCKNSIIPLLSRLSFSEPVSFCTDE